MYHGENGKNLSINGTGTTGYPSEKNEMWLLYHTKTKISGRFEISMWKDLKIKLLEDNTTQEIMTSGYVRTVKTR